MYRLALARQPVAPTQPPFGAREGRSARAAAARANG